VRRSDLPLGLSHFAREVERPQGASLRSAREDAAPAAPLTPPALASRRLAPSRQERQNNMLRIYPVVLDWLKALRPLIAQIARYDRDLAKQLRCSSSSVVLNLGEGMHSRGGHRTNAYGVSLREMRES